MKNLSHGEYAFLIFKGCLYNLQSCFSICKQGGEFISEVVKFVKSHVNNNTYIEL